MRVIENVVFAENYEDGNGNEKTRWHNIGVIMEGEKNGKTRRVLKLSMIPKSKDDDGFYNLFPYEPKDGKGDPMNQARNSYNNRDNQDGGGIDQSKPDNLPADDDMDKPIDLSEIPF